MKIIALLALTLLTANCIKMEQSVLAQITQNNEFGNAIMSMIELTVQNTSPSGQLVAIRDLLYQLEQDLAQQQTIAQNNFGNRELVCTYQTETLAAGISTLEAQVTDISAERTELLTEQGEIQVKVNEARTAIEADSQALASYQNELANLDDKFVAENENYQEAVTSCDESVRLLGQLAIQHASKLTSFAQNGIMFVQLSQKFQSVKEIMTTIVNQDHSLLMQPIIDVLVQLGTSSKIDLEQVQQIIALITTLRQSLWDGQALLETNHQNTRSDLENLVSALTTAIVNANNKVRSQEKRLSGIETGIAQKEKLFTNANDMLTLKQLLSANNEADCSQMRENFTKLTSLRNNSLEVLQKLLEYFNEQIDAAQSE